MGREFKIRCSKCRHWLANASGDAFSVELKCRHCGAVTVVKVREGSMTMDTEWGQGKPSPAESVA